jgi:GAF domain-containing protein
MTKLAAALAAPDQPGAYMAALERLVGDTIGVRLFTLMEINRARGVAARIHSSNPDAYPVAGEKPFPENAWMTVIQAGKMFVANTHAEIAAVFPDHELIRSLGCESCLNIPVTIGGEVVGTLNCLHEAGHFTPERLAAADALSLPGAVAFLLAARARKETAHG